MHDERIRNITVASPTISVFMAAGNRLRCAYCGEVIRIHAEYVAMEAVVTRVRNPAKWAPKNKRVVFNYCREHCRHCHLVMSSNELALNADELLSLHSGLQAFFTWWGQKPRDIFIGSDYQCTLWLEVLQRTTSIVHAMTAIGLEIRRQT